VELTIKSLTTKMYNSSHRSKVLSPLSLYRSTIFDYIHEISPKQRFPEVRMIRPETSCVITERSGR